MPDRRPTAAVAVMRGLPTWTAAEDDVDLRAGLPLLVTTPVAPGLASDPSRPDTETDVVVDVGGVADDVHAVMARRWTT